MAIPCLNTGHVKEVVDEPISLSLTFNNPQCVGGRSGLICQLDYQELDIARA